jgi:hypothetical protein
MNIAVSSDGRHVFARTLNNALHRWSLTDAAIVAVKPAQENKNVPAAKRVPVPGEEARAAAAKVVEDQFKTELAQAKRATAERVALAERLLQLGLETKDDLAARYVLLDEAREQAAQAGKVALSLAATEELIKSFEINPLDVRRDALAALTKGPLGKDAAFDVIEAAMKGVAEAVAADRPDAIRAYADTAEAAAKKGGSQGLITQVQKHQKEIQALLKEFEQMKAAQDVLAKDAAKAEANLTVGRYLAIRKGDWDTGLPLLAKGGGGDLADLARKDRANPTDPKARVELAEAWSAAAGKEAGWAKHALQGRALHWYRAALPMLSGLTEKTTLDRVKQLEEQPSPLRVVEPLGELRRYAGHTAAVTCVSLSADGKRLYSGSLDGTFRVWDVASAKLKLTPLQTGVPVQSFAVSPDERFLVTSGQTTSRIWDLRVGAPATRDAKDSVPGAFWCDPTHVYWTTRDAHYTYSLTGRSTGSGPLPNPTRAVVASPDGGWYVTLGDQANLHGTFPGGGRRDAGTLNTPDPTAAGFSPDSKYVAVAGKDKTVRVCEVRATREMKSFPAGHAGAIRCVAVTPNGKRVVTGGDDKMLRVWDVETGKELHAYAHTGAVLAVAVAADGQSVFSAGADATIRHWNLPREKK